MARTRHIILEKENLQARVLTWANGLPELHEALVTRCKILGPWASFSEGSPFLSYF